MAKNKCMSNAIRTNKPQLQIYFIIFFHFTTDELRLRSKLLCCSQKGTWNNFRISPQHKSSMFHTNIMQLPKSYLKLIKAYVLNLMCLWLFCWRFLQALESIDILCVSKCRFQATFFVSLDMFPHSHSITKFSNDVCLPLISNA